MKTSITLNEIQAESVDESIVLFSEPLYIVGTRARQWNGTIYDLNSTDITQWDGTITADHSDKLQDVIGKAIGLNKRKDGITISGIKYAIKENPLAILAKNLLTGGFATGFSCETVGPDPDDNGVWHNHSLCGLSQVSHPNDKLAYAVVENSRKEAQKYGWKEKEVNNAFDAFVEEKTMNKITEVERRDVKGFCPYEFTQSIMNSEVLTIDPSSLKKAIFENGAEIVPRDGLGINTALILNELKGMTNEYYQAYESRVNLSEEARELIEEQKSYYLMFQRRAIIAANEIDEWAEEDYERIRKAIIPLAENHVEYLKKLALENKTQAPDYDALIRNLKDLSAVELKKDAESTRVENRAIVFKDVKENNDLIEKSKLSIISRKEDE